MEFTPMLALLALAKKIVDVARYGRGRDWNGVITQVLAWVAGAGVVVAFARSDFASLVAFDDYSLDRMNLFSQVIVGFTVGSWASLVQDGIKAVDGSQSEAKPPMVPDAPASASPRHADGDR